MFNNDVEYASSRLVNSYLKVKQTGKLAFIVDILRSKANRDSLAEANVICHFGKAERKSLKIDEFEYSVGQLGYVNSFASGAGYLVRLPLRRSYKQGLQHTQLAIQKNTSMSGVDNHWMTNNLTKVEECLAAKYPSVDSCVEVVEESDFDIAFSKNFAISYQYNLLYKGYKVGKLTKDDKFKLDTTFNFLEQQLAKEAGNDKISI